jgi:hypothetical protein
MKAEGGGGASEALHARFQIEFAIGLASSAKEALPDCL